MTCTTKGITVTQLNRTVTKQRRDMTDGTDNVWDDVVRSAVNQLKQWNK